VALEQALTERYGLSHTRIADPLDAMSVQPQVARCAADLIASECRLDSVVAVSNGRSVSSTIAALPDLHLPRTRVVQMIGSTPYSDMMHDSSETCRQIALKLGGSLVTLPTPLIVSNAAAARSLMSIPQVRSVLAESARADIALVGVGAVHDGCSGSIFSGVESAGLAAQLIRRGAVAHICGHHIDATGAHVETSLCHRTIAVTPETLRAIPLVVAVAWGADKVPATRALLAGGYLHALVTDRDTAIALASD
jgi:DNA-binding transcriptional regulator LsrR (DeoR family)